MGTAVAAPLARPGLAATLEEIFKYQNQLVDTGNYEFLGRMKRIVLEAEQDARTQAPGITSKIGHVLEWYNQPHPRGGMIQNYVPIAQSRDHKMVLALEPILKRDLMGRLTPEVGLPNMPDPSWKPQSPKNTKEAEEWARLAAAEGRNVSDPTMIAQDLNQLTQKMLQGSEYLVFQPVVQVLFQPVVGDALQATYWTLLFSYDPASKTYPAFLVDRKTGEAHFYGGKYEIVPVG